MDPCSNADFAFLVDFLVLTAKVLEDVIGGWAPSMRSRILTGVRMLVPGYRLDISASVTGLRRTQF